MGWTTSATIRGKSYSRGTYVTLNSGVTHYSSADGTSNPSTAARNDHYFYGVYSASWPVLAPYHVSVVSGAADGRYYKEDAFPYATYTVSFNANGGSGAPSSQTKTYGSTLYLSSTRPTRTNYNFKGWGTSSSATSASYQPGGAYTSNSGITLYAVWELAVSAPSAPSGVGITKNSNTSATITWTNNPVADALGGLTGTKIYRDTNGSVGSTNLNSTTSATQTSFTDTGITTNNRYRYKLDAYNDYGTSSAYSGYIYTTPAAPKSAFGMNNNGNVTLSVNASNVNYPSTYTWQRSQDQSTWTTISLTAASGSDSHSLTGNVYYRVRANAPDGTAGSWYTFLCGNRINLYFWIPG